MAAVAHFGIALDDVMGVGRNAVMSHRLTGGLHGRRPVKLGSDNIRMGR